MKQALPITHIVAITFAQKSFIQYYFTDRSEAIKFYMNYCWSIGMIPTPLLITTKYSREERPGITIDFDTIAELVIESIFELS